MTNRVWIVREPDRLFVIFARCTHLGCTPEWKPAENKFKCPCHGSGYDSEGVNFEGPAPRPMDRALLKLDPTGQIVVDTSRLFVDDPRAGVNHFNDPGAFLERIGRRCSYFEQLDVSAGLSGDLGRGWRDG